MICQRVPLTKARPQITPAPMNLAGTSTQLQLSLYANQKRKASESLAFLATLLLPPVFAYAVPSLHINSKPLRGECQAKI